MKYKKNEYVIGTVTGIESYGIFVSLDDYYSGLIHISEISDYFVKDINDYVKLGDTIKAKIIGIDEENYHLQLSIKNVNYKKPMYQSEPIEEVGSGFQILYDNLPKFIKEKLSEISSSSS